MDWLPLLMIVAYSHAEAFEDALHAAGGWLLRAWRSCQAFARSARRMARAAV